MFRGRILEWLRWSLLIAGCLTLGYTGAEWASGRIEQAKASRELDRILFEQAAKSEPPAAKYIADGSLIGKVEIPDLHLSAVVKLGLMFRAQEEVNILPDSKEYKRDRSIIRKG
jgi:hypothetical protein